MTRILDDVKLDFKDVLILPKRSELTSRPVWYGRINELIILEVV